MTATGDKWVSDCGSVTLYCGDCLSLLPTLPRVDAVVTDPPYGVNLGSRDNNNRKREAYQSTNDSEDIIGSVVLPAIEQCRRIASRVAVTTGNRHLFAYQKPDHVLCIYQPAGAGCNSWGFSTWQPLVVYGKDPYGGRGSLPDSFRNVEQSEKNGHPCPKPIGLMVDIVERVTLSEETILDPFMGSGTTGVACVRTGRRFIGVELEPKYFDIAVRRIKAELNARKNALFDPVEYRVTQKEMFAEATA